jgi:large subunit ribosomal protein L15
MRLDSLEKPKGSTTRRKRVGRGSGSGLGKTSGRGHKGAKARSGYKTKLWREGGQMPILRRIPKRGFTNINRTEYQVVNLADLEGKFAAGAEITIETLKEKKLVRTVRKPVKVLGSGELKTSLTLKVHAASQSAIEKVAAAGGKVEIV